MYVHGRNKNYRWQWKLWQPTEMWREKESENGRKIYMEHGKNTKWKCLLITSTISALNGVNIRWIRLLCVKRWNIYAFNVGWCAPDTTRPHHTIAGKPHNQPTNNSSTHRHTHKLLAHKIHDDDDHKLKPKKMYLIFQQLLFTVDSWFFPILFTVHWLLWNRIKLVPPKKFKL